MWLQKISQNITPSSRDMRIMVFQGSARHQGNCPGQWGKTRKLAKYAISNFPDNIKFDFCDLSVSPDLPIIQPCKACISTAGGFHCHFPCDCYSSGDKDRPDFMSDEDIYTRLLKADGFVLFTPINWYSVPTQVKAMFDRLVCGSLTITSEQAKELTEDDSKNPEKTRALEQSGKYNNLLKNHFAGKFGAFFIHGDNGANDYQEQNKGLSGSKPHEPSSYRGRNEVEYERINYSKQAVMPLVWQCRYSGIEVPDDCVYGTHINEGYSYSSGNDRYPKMKDLFKNAKGVVRRLIWHLNGGTR